jgi:predicted O-linked N-acetylglucosamine transferase (SPINDLY family)
LKSSFSSELQLALELIAAGNWHAARSRCEQLMAVEPDSAEIQHALGLVCWGENELHDSARHLEMAAAARPDEAGWHNDLGIIYALQHRWVDALACFARCLNMTPDDLDAQWNCARAHAELCQHGSALRRLKLLLEKQPGWAAAWAEMGRVLLDSGEAEEAEKALLQSLTLNPSLVRARELLADLCLRRERLTEAVIHARELVRLRPDSRSWSCLALAFWHAGDIGGCITACDAAFFRGVSDPQTHSTLLYLQLFDPGQSGERLCRAHLQWARTHLKRLRSPPSFANRPDSNRPLKIGYLTAALLTTPTYYFVAPFLSNHNRDEFAIYVYDACPDESCSGSSHDEVAVAWRDVRNTSAEAIAKMIHQDGIDILVDLMGHHSLNRLDVFSLRPAPLQVTFPNYPCTTGLAEIDYFLTDVWTSPLGVDSEYVEHLHRLPTGCLVYSPPPSAPAVAPLPALDRGYVTFGVFQRPAKMNPRFWDSVAAVLHHVPKSRLLLHHSSPEYGREGSVVRELIRSESASRGISIERISFCGTLPLPAHLELLAQADIALDTFPYNGQTTTCECLWMGVPVITRAGNSHVSRVGSGIMHQAGFSTWVAASAEHYLAIATQLAGDLYSLASCRAGMRTRVSASPLVDAAARTRQLEAAYRRFWCDWCTRGGSNAAKGAALR